jgi:hypothetical protein
MKDTGFHAISKNTYLIMKDSGVKDHKKISKDGLKKAAVRLSISDTLEEIRISKEFNYL